MVLILKQSLKVNRVLPDKKLGTTFIQAGSHRIEKIPDPTGKLNRYWWVLADDKTVGMPVEYFNSFLQASGANKIVIREEG